MHKKKIQIHTPACNGRIIHEAEKTGARNKLRQKSLSTSITLTCIMFYHSKTSFFLFSMNVSKQASKYSLTVSTDPDHHFSLCHLSGLPKRNFFIGNKSDHMISSKYIKLVTR